MASDDHQLFSKVKFYVTPDISSQLADELANLLESKGGTKADLNNATHIIAKSPYFEGNEKVRNDAAIVSVRVGYCLLLSSYDDID